jgi:hypothetical protein
MADWGLRTRLKEKLGGDFYTPGEISDALTMVADRREEGGDFYAHIYIPRTSAQISSLAKESEYASSAEKLKEKGGGIKMIIPKSSLGPFLENLGVLTWIDMHEVEDVLPDIRVENQKRMEAEQDN